MARKPTTSKAGRAAKKSTAGIIFLNLSIKENQKDTIKIK